MKRLISVANALTFAFLLPAVALAKGHHSSSPHVSGTITAWDEGAKQATVKDSAGKEHMFGWNEKTTVTGTPKIGEHASVHYTKDKDGKVWATHVSFGEKPAPAKTTGKG